MNEDIQRIERRITHLRGFAGFFRVLGSIYLVFVMILSCMSAFVFSVSAGLGAVGLAELAGLDTGGNDFVVIFNLLFFGFIVASVVSSTIPAMLMFAVADHLISLADDHFIQLNIMHRVGYGISRSSGSSAALRRAAKQKPQEEKWIYD